MKRVAVESPYAGYVDYNTAYAKACVNDSLKRGEAPYASHLFYTQEGLLNDTIPEERKLGMEAGKIWELAAEVNVLCIDLGISSGMVWGAKEAFKEGREVKFRDVPNFEYHKHTIGKYDLDGVKAHMRIPLNMQVGEYVRAEWAEVNFPQKLQEKCTVVLTAAKPILHSNLDSYAQWSTKFNKFPNKSSSYLPYSIVSFSQLDLENQTMTDELAYGIRLDYKISEVVNKIKLTHNEHLAKLNELKELSEKVR